MPEKSDFEVVFKKLDQLDSRLDSIDVTLARQEENLKEHMRRTDLLENEMRPIQKHVAQWEGGLKILGFVSIAISILLGILKIFYKI